MGLSKIIRWVEDRSGLGKVFSTFLNEQIPASTGWRNTLGALAGAFLLLQILTGILLTLYYVPHPEAAYQSLQWVAENISLGALVRSLHYWGASFIIVALFIHTIRVFLSGAYKKPRELTWLVGLALFGTVITLAFTGILLPYNQMGYWSARVGIEIASSAPFIGTAIRDMLTGGDIVGALTLTRFYTLHIIILPLVLAALVGFHLYLLRKHGPARPQRDTTSDMQPFFPMQFLRDMVVISLGLAAIAAVAIIVKGPHESPLDFTDASYVPRPEWYFFAHFEILKLTEGEFQKVLAAFVLPYTLIIALAALPWLDRSSSAAIGKRKAVVGMGLFVAASIVGLTLLGLSSASESDSDYDIVVEEDASDDPERRLLAAGRRVYAEQRCQSCHRINGRGEVDGPDLSGTGLRLQEGFVRRWLRNPEAFKPDATMPPVMVSQEKFDLLVFYLMSLDRDTVD